MNIKTHGYSEYQYRVDLYQREFDGILEWLLKHVGDCEYTPRSLLRGSSVEYWSGNHPSISNNKTPQWCAKQYTNGRVKFYFMDAKKALLFKLVWASK